MKYTTTLYKTVKKETEIDAENPSDALAKIRAENPGYSTDYVFDEFGENFEEIANCEHCGVSLFEEDEYETFSDGVGGTVELCGPCAQKSFEKQLNNK